MIKFNNASKNVIRGVLIKFKQLTFTFCITRSEQNGPNLHGLHIFRKLFQLLYDVLKNIVVKHDIIFTLITICYFTDIIKKEHKYVAFTLLLSFNNFTFIIVTFVARVNK